MRGPRLRLSGAGSLVAMKLSFPRPHTRCATMAGPVVLAAAALALGACGDEEEAPADPGEPAAAQTTSTTTAEGATTTEREPSGSDGAPPPADREVRELTGFSSPSGNIGCAIEPLGVRCDISERSWSPPEAPASCDLDYGQGIELTTGGTADFVCAGDTTLDGGEVLEYGQSITAGLLRCESRESGMRCVDIETGRGFVLAREGYEIF